MHYQFKTVLSLFSLITLSTSANCPVLSDHTHYVLSHTHYVLSTNFSLFNRALSTTLTVLFSLSSSTCSTLSLLLSYLITLVLQSFHLFPSLDHIPSAVLSSLLSLFRQTSSWASAIDQPNVLCRLAAPWFPLSAVATALLFSLVKLFSLFFNSLTVFLSFSSLSFLLKFFFIFLHNSNSLHILLPLLLSLFLASLSLFSSLFSNSLHFYL